MLVYEKAKPLGGESLNYRVWGNPAPALGIGTNLLCNTYNNSIDGITKTENGGLQINPAEFTSGRLMIGFPVYLESGKTYTVRSPYDTTHGKLGLLNITGTASGFQDNGTAPDKTFTWGSENVGKLIFSFDVDVLDSLGEIITFYPQINEGSELLDYEPYKTKENTIWVNTDIDITEHAFGYENPWVYYEDVDYIATSTIVEDKYLDSEGDAKADNNNSDPCYTENYIPVVYGATYSINYTLSASKSMWFAIAEYMRANDSGYVFKARNIPENVNQVTGTAQTFTYTPSSSDVTAVRLSWRTFSASGVACTATFTGIKRFDMATVGDTWVSTDIDNATVSFNAIKRNEIMVYPRKVRQWNGDAWKAKETYLCHDNDSEKICGAEFNAMTDIEWNQSAYGSDKNNIVFTNTNALKQVDLSTAGGQASGVMYFPIDLSQYSTMTISCSSSGTYAVGDIGFATHINDTYSAKANKIYDISLIEKFEGKASGSCIDKVYDISAYNQRNAYFKMHMYDGSTAYSASSFNITKLVFE